MKLIKSTCLLFLLNIAITRAQVFTGSGGSIITLTDTSRFNINVSGLSPSTMDFNFGLESVTISINHTRDADIDCFLAAPDGTLIELTTDNGGTSDNYVNTVFRHDASTPITSGTAPFTGTYRPEGELWRVNNGQNGNGTWQLRVIDDNNNGVTGSLVSWKLSFGNTPAKTFVFDQSDLPIVVINTSGQNIVDDPKIIANMGIINNGPGQRNHLSDPANDYTGKIAIEIRGSSSQSFPKKSYGFETRGANPQIDTNVSLLGMPVEHDWILSANYTDKSFCRNVLSYQLAREMGHYAVRTRYVDLVLNGTYKGIYVLMESIKRDKNRVDVSKLHPYETTYPDVSGGYILKIDKTTGSGGAGWNSPYQPINHSNNQKIYFQYDYPKPDSIVVSQKAYIQAYVDSFESRLNGPNFMDSTLGYAKYIGNNSFIDYFFSNEISKNVDGYRISTYLYKDKEKTLKAGPVWDYDIAWGNANYCEGNLTTGWAYQFPCTSDGFQPPFWWQKMLQDSNYANQMKCRWVEFRTNILSNTHINSVIDSIAQVLNESQSWNFTVWPILGTYVWPNPSPYPSTYAGEITALKNWIASRLSYMDANLPGRCNCSLTIARQDVSCFNVCDGQAVALGVSPYKKIYTWDSGETSDTIRNLCPGLYDLQFEDAIGCKKSLSVTISQPSALSSTPASTNASCAGNNCNGSASVSVNGGTTPYTYQWSNGQTANNITGLCAGNYSVTITDAHGCTKNSSVTIANPSAPLVSVLSQTPVSCFGASNGAASVNVSGGTGPFTYAWSPSGGTGSSAGGLSAGNYVVNVTDQNGCQTSKAITINSPAAIQINSSHTDALCFGTAGGTASLTVSGGTSPYKYLWSPGNSTNNPLTLAGAGTYSCTVTDANSCTSNVSVLISQPSPIQISATGNPAACFGTASGSAQAVVSGGVAPYSYQWTPSGATGSQATGLSAGTYSVLVSDANMCTKSVSVSVGQAAAISLATSSVPATCGNADGAASVSVSGGTGPYQYQWLPAGGTDSVAQNLSAGTYTIRVTDAGNCSTSTQVHVVNSNGLSSVVNNKTDVTCAGRSDGSASVIASNGTQPYQYSWSPGGGTSSAATGLSAGIYTVTIQDANGCINIQQVNIAEPAALSVSVSATMVKCFGGNDGSATAAASGGTSPYTYQWSPAGGSAALAANLGAGNYSVLITDANACTTSKSVVIDQNSQLQTSFSHTNASCGLNNGSAQAFVSGGTAPYAYSWSTGTGTLNSLASVPAGSYTLTVTDSLNCSANSNIVIGGTSAPHLSVLSQADITCNGGNDGQLSLACSSGTGPFTYTWNPAVSSSSSASGISSGIYSIHVSDQNNCADSISVLVDQPAPLAMLMFTTDVSCQGAANGEIFADAGGGTSPYTYQWSPGGQSSDTARNLSPGTYSVLVTDFNGCTSSASASIGEPSLMTASVVSTNEICGGACDGSAEVQVSGGTSPYRFLWCDGDTAMRASHLCEGVCSVLILDGNNCQVRDTVIILGPDPLDVSTNHIDASCIGCLDGTAMAGVTGGTPPYSYAWSPGGQTSSSVSGLGAGTYQVCVTDSLLCEKCESFVILDGSTATPEVQKLSAFYVYPNPFTERTTFIFSLPASQFVSLEIFDASGRLVRSILEEKLEAGEHSIQLEAASLINGIYFWRFISDERSGAGRLLLNR